MYGTVARLKVKPEAVDELIALMAEWEQSRKPNVKGAVASYVYKLDNSPNELMLCAVFSDKAAYVANADDPEQDKWFQRMSEHLAGEPEWNDGEIIHSS